MKNIKLIAFDLDGTVLMDDHLQEAPGILNALETACRQGIYTVPVTGRPYGLLPPVFSKDRSWYSYGIFCNGSQIRNMRNGEILKNFPLPKEAKELLIRQSEDCGVPAEFSIDGKIYLTKEAWDLEEKDPRLKFHCGQILKKRGVLVESLRELLEKDVEKAHMNGVSGKLQKVFYEEYNALNLNCAWSEDGYGEITHPEATKGKALEKLCRMIGIPLEQVLALGDSSNDISMLQAAGTGIAMGNASDYVKKEADSETWSNEQDGAAAAISYYLSI